MTVYERIKGRRQELQMTQAQLAADIGADKGTISRIESGQMDISVSRLMLISNSLQCTAGYLLGEAPSGIEDQLLYDYRKTDNWGRAIITMLARMESERGEEK